MLCFKQKWHDLDVTLATNVPETNVSSTLLSFFFYTRCISLSKYNINYH